MGWLRFKENLEFTTLGTRIVIYIDGNRMANKVVKNMNTLIIK